MVSRIEVIPSEVRGYGNIVGAKSISDFVPVNSEISYSEDVYSLTAATGVRILLSASSTSVTYGSSVVLTATVMDSDTPVTGETVSFYDGETLLGSDTTDSSGEATYTTISLTVGVHGLSAVYDEKTSNTVNVTVNKITPTITISVPSTGTVGSSYTVSGSLSVDGGANVKLYENGSLKDTLIVSSGSFSKSITQNSEGTYSYYAVFEGSYIHESVTSSTGSIVVSDTPAPTPASVTLTSDKSILSYADSESATLSATVLDSNDDPIEGVTVEFFKGSTSLGTADTNSSGVATKSYASAGVGDISLKAQVGSLVSETYGIEDCIFYDPLTSNHTHWTVSGALGYNAHDSTGWKYGNSSSLVWIDINGYSHDGDIAVEYTPTEAYSGSNGTYAPFMLYFEKTSSSRAYATQRNTGVQLNSSDVTSHNVQLGDEYRVEYTGTTVKYYHGDTLLGSGSHSLGNTGIKPRLATGANGRYCRIKDFKIKPL